MTRYSFLLDTPAPNFLGSSDIELKGGSMKNFLAQTMSKFIQLRKGENSPQISISDKIWMVDVKREAENRAFLSLRAHFKKIH